METYSIDDMSGSMRPPFSYYGGKQRMASKIVKLLPPHTVYVEPFCGSGAVMFKKGLPPLGNGDHYREVLNDTDGRVTNFFRVCQDKDKREALLDRLEWTVYSESDFKFAQEIVLNQSNPGDVDLAWAWFICTNWSFTRRIESKISVGVHGINFPATHVNQVNRLTEFRDRLSHCFVMSESALECIKRWDSPQTLFYIDPPYPKTSQSHYSGYTQDDFQNLITILKAIQGSFLLSCYDNDAVPSEWERFDFNATCTAGGVSSAGTKGKRVEVVWRKLSTETPKHGLKEIGERHYTHFQQVSDD